MVVRNIRNDCLQFAAWQQAAQKPVKHTITASALSQTMLYPPAFVFISSHVNIVNVLLFLLELQRCERLRKKHLTNNADGKKHVIELLKLILFHEKKFNFLFLTKLQFQTNYKEILMFLN